MAASIEDLPDFPALAQLASALWRDGSGRGAAVLVGAGFSRNAERSGADTPVPPLWGNIARAMEGKLYGRHTQQAPADPLRLAEEFRSYLGEAALTELIRSLIPDSAWYPGRLHRELLALPWSDVLTTNWDTLLERTARNMPVVKAAADLPHVRSPRIVKLHGTIQDSGSLIFTEEDYRRYPVTHAAFVNLARQVFLENELCLVGFSGDDPNFLQWSGWVRDNLAGGARRIYLVGALGLGPAKRSLLEKRNVAPIDLSPLFAGTDRADVPAAAMTLFLDFLRLAKPKHRIEWTIAEGSSYGVSVSTTAASRPAADPATLDRITDIWRLDRERCPNWLVCPADQRQTLKFATAHTPFLYWQALDTLPAERRAAFLYELSWRHSYALWPVEPELLRRVSLIIDPSVSPPVLSRVQRLWLAEFVATEARLTQDWDTFDLATAVLSCEAGPGSDEHAGLAFQRALRSRDDLDPQKTAKLVASIDGPDPSWKLRRAALQFELGEFDAAKASARLAVKELDERLIGDPQSVWLSTRRAWAAVVERAIDIGENGFFSTAGQVLPKVIPRYDPERELDRLRREAARDVSELGSVDPDFEPSFSPGAYKDNTAIMRFRSVTQVTVADTLERLVSMAGVPTRTDGVDVLASCALDAARAAFEPTLAWYVFAIRSLGSYDDPLLEVAFSRIAIARMAPDLAQGLLKRVTRSADFWKSRATEWSGREATFAVGRLRLFLQILSRLVLREDEPGLLATFRLSSEITSTPELRHPWLLDHLDDLSRRSLAAMPRSVAADLALASMEFPLPESDPGPFRWPNPVRFLFNHGIGPRRPEDDPVWRVAVAKALEAAATTGQRREQAIERLAYLSFHSALTEEEKTRFANVLWRQVPDGDALPDGAMLFPHVLARLPAPASIDALSRGRAVLFEKALLEGECEEQLDSIVAAVTVEPSDDRIIPTPAQALSLFDQMMALCPSKIAPKSPIGGIVWRRRLSIASHAASVGLLPNLDPSDLNDERVGYIMAVAEPGHGGHGLIGLPYLAAKRPDLLDEVSRRVRRALFRGDFRDVAGATRAVVVWMEEAVAGRVASLPDALIDSVVSAIASGRMAGLRPLLWCARRLFESNLLRQEQVVALRDSLGELSLETAYDNIPTTGADAIGVTLVRAACVTLSRSLEKAGAGDGRTRAWLECAGVDPLPEVRAAGVEDIEGAAG